MSRTTPEGKVKAAVKDILGAYVPYVYGHWFVPYIQKNTVDYHGCCCGLYFLIECKGSKLDEPTPMQLLTLKSAQDALGTTFVVKTVDGDDIKALDAWLHHHVMAHKGKMHHAHQRKTR